MIVTIPYFSGYTDYSRLATAINKQGRQDGHTLLVMSRRTDEEDAMAFQDKVKNSFSHHLHRVVDPPQTRGRFAMSNEMLRQALWYMGKHEPAKGEAPGLPMLYFEANSTPSKRGWANAIQSEHFAQGAPQVLAHFAETEGRRVPQGSVLFSKDYGEKSALLASLPAHIHWREYLRHEIGRNSRSSDTLVIGKKGVFVQARSPRKAVSA